MCFVFQTITSFSNVGLVLLFGSLLILAGCELDTRITITDSKNPPTFQLSGNGRLGSIIVAGPYDKLEDLESLTVKVGRIWEIQRGYGELPINKVPAITYGALPNGFTQRIPTSGSPPALIEGKLYAMSAPSINAGFRILCFSVSGGAVAKVACRER
jgi:hypothetical protein